MSSAHLQLAKLCQGMYSEDLSSFDQVFQSGYAVMGGKWLPDANVLIPRGSCKAIDFVEDAEAVPVWHKQLGFMHAGMMNGVDGLFEQVINAIPPDKPVIVSGHSLGGARAVPLAMLLYLAGYQVSIVTFGAPKPSFANLRRIVEKSGMSHTAYRNRNDVVPMMPFAPWWVSSAGWTALDAAPPITNLEPLRDHSMALYVKALEG